MKITPKKTSVRGETRWMISFRNTNGKRQRQFFQSKSEASAAADQLNLAKTSSGSYWSAMSAETRTEAALILSEITDSGFSLRQVWDAFKTKEELPISICRKTIGDAIKECVTSKTVAGRRQRYVDMLQYYLENFAKGRESALVPSFKTEAIESFLSAYESAGTRATWLNRLSTLFSFCVRRGWITHNPCDRIERVNIDQPTPKILTPEETVKILGWLKTHPKALAWFILATFCGIRPEECDKMTRDQIHLDRGIVMVTFTKTRTRRIIHMEPNTIAWMKLASDLKSPLPLNMVTRRRCIRELRDFMGWEEWPKDILRKTAASYMMAKYQDAGKVSDELGNSAGILLKHYRELVEKSVAEQFFAITP